MARKRMLDPMIWEDPDFGTLSHSERLLFVGLISNADDDGRGNADPRYLRKVIFGFDENLSFSKVEEWLTKIASTVRGVTLYDVDGRQYYALLHWKRYQKISHPRASIIPTPPGTQVDLGEDNAGKIFAKWESAHGVITPAVAQEFGAMIDEWDAHLSDLPEGHVNRSVTGIDATFEALRVGIGAKTRPSVNYIWGILKNWMTQGYKAKASSGKKKSVKPGYTKEEIAKAKAERKKRDGK